MVRTLSIIFIVSMISSVGFCETVKVYAAFPAENPIVNVQVFENSSWHDMEVDPNMSFPVFSAFIGVSDEQNPIYFRLTDSNQFSTVSSVLLDWDILYGGSVCFNRFDDDSWFQCSRLGTPIPVSYINYSGDYIPSYGPSLPSLGVFQIGTWISLFEVASYAFIAGIIGAIMVFLVLKKSLKWAKSFDDTKPLSGKEQHGFMSYQGIKDKNV